MPPICLRIITFPFEEGFITPSDGVISGVTNGAINKITQSIFDLIKKDNNITTDALSEKTGKSLRTISREIKNLRDLGYIERIGSNKKGHWNVLKQ